MKVLLAMLARSHGEPYLESVLSIMGASFDGVEVGYDGGRAITDFAAARNRLIRLGESQGYDWIVMLDADECMYPRDIERVRALMGQGADFIALPMIEFVNDFEHWDPSPYPDYHGRVFRLGRGYHFRNKMHEMVFARRALLNEIERGVFARSDETPIYHYGKTKSAESVVEKFAHYERLEEGSTPLRFVQELAGELWPDAPEFTHPHPLDGSGRLVGDWAQACRVVTAPRHEVALLHEHADLLTELDLRVGALLGVGLDSAPMSRYLALRGHDVTVVDGDPDSIETAREVACPTDPVRYRAAGLYEPAASLPCQTFATAFSVGLMHKIGADEVRRVVGEQLRLANRVVFSVPSDRRPSVPLQTGRYLTPAAWEEELGPIGNVKARYYGARARPLRQAILAKVEGTLGQDRLHVMVTVTARF